MIRVSPIMYDVIMFKRNFVFPLMSYLAIVYELNVKIDQQIAIAFCIK